jgi:hypothetical protein
MAALGCLGQRISNKSRGRAGIGSWSPDLAVSPPLWSTAASDGVAMGAGDWATGEEKNGGYWALEEETGCMYMPCARVGENKKRSIFCVMGGNCG